MVRMDLEKLRTGFRAYFVDACNDDKTALTEIDALWLGVHLDLVTEIERTVQNDGEWRMIEDD